MLLRSNALVQGAHDEDSLGQAVQVDTSLGQGILAMYPGMIERIFWSCQATAVCSHRVVVRTVCVNIVLKHDLGCEVCVCLLAFRRTPCQCFDLFLHVTPQSCHVWPQWFQACLPNAEIEDHQPS